MKGWGLAPCASRSICPARNGFDESRTDKLATETLRTQRHALGMIAGRGADDAALQLLGRKLRHFVVGAAELEAENRLIIFALKQHLVAETRRQSSGRL